jgi:hypothetical protein
MTHLPTAVARVSAFLFFATTLWSTEPFKPDVAGEINTDWVADLDHLEPYEGKVHLPEYYYLAQFFEAPAMVDKANYLVILRTKDRRYLMRLSKIPADKFPGEAPKPDIEIEVPESLASVVYDLWVNALLEVRYERKQHGGFDGETYVFSTFVTSLGWMHGTTWSPSGDLPPTWMMNAGKKLVAFARDEKRDPKATEAELTVLRDKLFQYIKKNGKH